jgi:hypothetical protein
VTTNEVIQYHICIRRPPTSAVLALAHTCGPVDEVAPYAAATYGMWLPKTTARRGATTATASAGYPRLGSPRLADTGNDASPRRPPTRRFRRLFQSSPTGPARPLRARPRLADRSAPDNAAPIHYPSQMMWTSN